MVSEIGAGEVVYPLNGRRVWVAGHRGMVGSAIVRRLATEGCEVITADRREVDLERQDQVENWMAKAKPDAIFLAAAKVGGILANDSFPADFLYANLMIEASPGASWPAMRRAIKSAIKARKASIRAAMSTMARRF